MRAVRQCRPALKLGAMLCLAGIAAFAQIKGDPSFEARVALHDVSLDQYRAHLLQLKALVATCDASPNGCDAATLANDDRVADKGLGSGANVETFTARYQWLRTTLKNAAKAKLDERREQLSAAADRIDEQIREANAVTDPQTFVGLRHAADAILNRPEFNSVEEHSFLKRMAARFFLWLDSLFNGVARFGRRSPWITPLIEWGLVALAAVVLIVWAMRAARNQRLAVAQRNTPTQLSREAALNWLALAQQSAHEQDWRQAVHCLYWASIAVLERRRLWAPDKSRTPREYLCLVHAGEARDLLGQQTRRFERIWYGLRPASEADYAHAQQTFDQIDQT